MLGRATGEWCNWQHGSLWMIKRIGFESPLPSIQPSGLGFCATGRRYSVSDNAVRKWIRAYERQQARENEAA